MNLSRRFASASLLLSVVFASALVACNPADPAATEGGGGSPSGTTGEGGIGAGGSGGGTAGGGPLCVPSKVGFQGTLDGEPFYATYPRTSSRTVGTIFESFFRTEGDVALFGESDFAE